MSRIDFLQLSKRTLGKDYSIVGVCSSNSLATRRGTRNLIYILAFILLILLTTSAYSTSTLLLLHLLPEFKWLHHHPGDDG